MKLSIYLSEDAIQAVLGKQGRNTVQICDCGIYPLSPGTLINDVMNDESQVREVLCRIGEKYRPYGKNGYLMLGSSQILTKVVQTPILSGRQLLAVTRQEMAEYIGEESRYIYDYSVIVPKNRHNPGGTILCAAIEQETIHSYQKLFEECGIQLKSIDIARNAIARLAVRLEELQMGIFILGVLDGRNLLASLYVNGEFAYTNRCRLIAERKMEESRKEVLQVIRSMNQFFHSQNKSAHLDAVYLGGLKTEEMPILDEITASMGVSARTLELESLFRAKPGIEYSPEDYLYPSGNLLGK